jgi:putative FmdB family regulatory protein
MPLYDWKCINCELVFEAVSPMADSDFPQDCPMCDSIADRQFSPTTNICVPGHFKRDSNWHQSQGDRGPDSAPYSDTNSVHAPKRRSFRDKLEENLGIR